MSANEPRVFLFSFFRFRPISTPAVFRCLSDSSSSKYGNATCSNKSYRIYAKLLDEISRRGDDEDTRDCEIRIRKLKQDFNIWGSEVRKKEKAYEDEKYAAACRYMLSVTCDDDDDDNLGFYAVHPNTIHIPVSQNVEPKDSLIMGDEHINITPETETISVETLVSNPSESDDFSLGECNLFDIDDSYYEKSTSRLAHLAPISPEIVEVCVDDDDTDKDDDYDDDFEEDGGEIDFDISKIVDIPLREKLVESYLLIEKINTFNLSPPIPISPTNYPSSTIPVVDIDLPLEEADVLSFSDNSITRGIESDRDSGEDTTSIDDLPLDDSMILSEYESFTFDDEPVMAEVNVFDEINTSELSYPGFPDFGCSWFNIVEDKAIPQFPIDGLEFSLINGKTLISSLWLNELPLFFLGKDH
ncbi:hypothetical protein Tco_0186166 [Tanacetum coccineum]